MDCSATRGFYILQTTLTGRFANRNLEGKPPLCKGRWHFGFAKMTDEGQPRTRKDLFIIQPHFFCNQKKPGCPERKVYTPTCSLPRATPPQRGNKLTTGRGRFLISTAVAVFEGDNGFQFTSFARLCRGDLCGRPQQVTRRASLPRGEGGFCRRQKTDEG